MMRRSRGLLLLLGAGLVAAAVAWIPWSRARVTRGLPHQESDGARFAHPDPGTLHVRLNHLEFDAPFFTGSGAIPRIMFAAAAPRAPSTSGSPMGPPAVRVGSAGFEAVAHVAAGSPGTIVAHLYAASVPGTQRRDEGAPRRPLLVPPGATEVLRAELHVDHTDPVLVEMLAASIGVTDYVRFRLTAPGHDRPHSSLAQVEVPGSLAPSMWESASGKGGHGGHLDGLGGGSFFGVHDAASMIVLAEQGWYSRPEEDNPVLLWTWAVSFEPDEVVAAR